MDKNTNYKIWTEHLFKDLDSPTLNEVATYVKKTIQHSATVEHYLTKLGINVDDGQRPHDLMGPGNKLEWLVLRGLALSKRDTPEKQRRYQEAIELHRQGQHHHKWNTENPKATEDDLRYGAIDAIVSLREARDYQGGKHSYEAIESIIEKNPEHKRPFMRWALNAIKAIEEAGEECYDTHTSEY